MSSARYRFGRFVLDPHNRQLLQDGTALEINARYLDALTLLVREQGKLVSKDRFLEEVWRGVPVTDEALTQCIKTLRKTLGDEASNPTFIETVPKHGYRFIAAVESGDAPPSAAPPSATLSAAYSWRDFWLLGAAGVVGGGAAGFFGGLFYGFGGSPGPGMGAASVLVVLVSACVLIGLLAGAGVGFGIAATGFASPRFCQWSRRRRCWWSHCWRPREVARPRRFCAAVRPIARRHHRRGRGRIARRGCRSRRLARKPARIPLRRRLAIAALCGGVAGLIIALLGGRLMGGSLALLTEHFPNARFKLDQIGALFGEPGFGRITLTVTTSLEGALFSFCVVGALLLAGQRFSIGSADGTRTRSPALKAQDPNP